MSIPISRHSAFYGLYSKKLTRGFKDHVFEVYFLRYSSDLLEPYFVLKDWLPVFDKTLVIDEFVKTIPSGFSICAMILHPIPHRTVYLKDEVLEFDFSDEILVRPEIVSYCINRFIGQIDLDFSNWYTNEFIVELYRELYVPEEED